jgi:hypothetical protein
LLATTTRTAAATAAKGSPSSWPTAAGSLSPTRGRRCV